MKIKYPEVETIFFFPALSNKTKNERTSVNKENKNCFGNKAGSITN
jgi:hypothetical protein